MARLGSNRRPDTQDAAVQDPALAVATSPAVPRGLAERVLIIGSGLRQPIVAILVLVSLFTVLSGKPLDGLLLVTVATALAWDAGMARQPAQQGAWRLRSRPPRLRVVAVGSAAAVIYALTVGSFTRYSWPATAGVVGLGASVVVVGWGGPSRQRPIPAKFARIGAFTWGFLFVGASLWELAALLMQPNIETSSYAHPTISTLTDPLLASAPGRAIALLGWIALGAYLVER